MWVQFPQWESQWFCYCTRKPSTISCQCYSTLPRLKLKSHVLGRGFFPDVDSLEIPSLLPHATSSLIDSGVVLHYLPLAVSFVHPFLWPPSRYPTFFTVDWMLKVWFPPLFHPFSCLCTFIVTYCIPFILDWYNFNSLTLSPSFPHYSPHLLWRVPHLARVIHTFLLPLLHLIPLFLNLLWKQALFQAPQTSQTPPSTSLQIM